jgi:CheY-like chemotaxis protein
MQTPKTVLLVDDDGRNIFALSAVLKSRGYSVLSASSVVEAMGILQAQPDVGLLLLDVMMPGMDGYEAMTLLKGDEALHHIPIIDVTAQAMSGDRERCLEAGADEYLSKPVDVDALTHLLHKFLNGKAAEGYDK